MAEARPSWADRLRGVFERLPGATAQRPSAALDADELARDLAEERAAIMEYEGGLPRAQAEALAFSRYGLPPPNRR